MATPNVQSRISVKVQPNAGRNQVVGLANGVWKVKIGAPPEKGKANRELVEFLSERLGLRKDAVTVIRGETSHNKIILIEGLTEAEIGQRLARSDRA